MVEWDRPRVWEVGASVVSTTVCVDKAESDKLPVTVCGDADPDTGGRDALLDGADDCASVPAGPGPIGSGVAAASEGMSMG